jgi:hypothetical protein
MGRVGCGVGHWMGRVKARVDAFYSLLCSGWAPHKPGGDCCKVQYLASHLESTQ